MLKQYMTYRNDLAFETERRYVLLELLIILLQLKGCRQTVVRLSSCGALVSSLQKSMLSVHFCCSAAVFLCSFCKVARRSATRSSQKNSRTQTPKKSE